MAFGHTELICSARALSSSTDFRPFISERRSTQACIDSVIAVVLLFLSAVACCAVRGAARPSARRATSSPLRPVASTKRRHESLSSPRVDLLLGLRLLGQEVELAVELVEELVGSKAAELLRQIALVAVRVSGLEASGPRSTELVGSIRADDSRPTTDGRR